MSERAEFEKYYEELTREWELPQELLTRYRILKQMRRGEGKELYLAEEPETFERVVIKMAYGRQREFLRYEAENLRQLWADLERGGIALP